ncbi:MAG: hypothetical protein JG781_1779 [Peptococcaceae bacterium]|nr:hypothetical protein [Peptococcaceae bacterium]
MTHSLHRRGTAESLKNDYVLLVTAAADVNHVGSKEKLRKVLEVVWDIGPSNIGSYDTGTVYAGVNIEEIKAALNEIPRVRCAFSSREKIKEVIRRIKELDLGMSVTVQGPTEDILEMSRELGIKPHSVNLSLDIWGKTGDLPSDDVLEVVTQCGHGLISRYLVEKAIAEVKAGKKTPRQAAEMVAHPCVCGIYNPDRAEEVFKRYALASAEAAATKE